MRDTKGITLLSLIVTILVLLILAGVTDAILINNSIIDKAKLAKVKIENAEAEEEIVLNDYENKMAQVSGENKDTPNVVPSNACSPKLLTSMILPNSGNSERVVGTYYANTTNFTKNNSEKFEDYLSYDEAKGWVVKKSGYYMINSELYCYYSGEYMDSDTYIVIDETEISINTSGVRTTLSYEKSSNNTTVYLEKGTVINFYNRISNGSSLFHYVSLKVFALFN